MPDVRVVGESAHLPQPVPQRHPDGVHPAAHLGDDHAVVEHPRREGGERQHRDEETCRDAAKVDRHPPRPPQAEDHDDEHRDDRPRLDDAGETEGDTAPDQPPAAAGDPVTVKHGHGPGQAEQHQPWLDEQRVGGGNAVRVDRHYPAGEQRGNDPPVPDEQAG